MCRSPGPSKARYQLSSESLLSGEMRFTFTITSVIRTALEASWRFGRENRQTVSSNQSENRQKTRGAQPYWKHTMRIGRQGGGGHAIQRLVSPVSRRSSHPKIWWTKMHLLRGWVALRARRRVPVFAALLRVAGSTAGAGVMFFGDDSPHDSPLGDSDQTWLLGHRGHG